MINRKNIFAKLNIKKDDRILEIGNKKNYFAQGFSNRVGKDGRVYYFDTARVELDKIERLRKINVESHYLNGGEFKIKGELDLIFLNDAYASIKDKVEYFRYMKKYLKECGILVIVEPDFGLNLNTILGRTTKRDVMVEEMVYAGFRLRHEYFFVKGKSFIVFEKE